MSIDKAIKYDMKNKVKVITNNVPESCINYLTNGKIYEAYDGIDEDLYTIVNDNGLTNLIRLNHCAHLDGKSWEIVNE